MDLLGGELETELILMPKEEGARARAQRHLHETDEACHWRQNTRAPFAEGRVCLRSQRIK